MELIDDVEKVIKHSWTIRLSIISAVAGALAQFQDQLPAVAPYIGHWVGPLSIACAIGATVARTIKQEKISGTSQ
jgi:hypothetical protein